MICVVCRKATVEGGGMICKACRAIIDSGDADAIRKIAGVTLVADPSQFVRVPEPGEIESLTPYQINFINHSNGQCPYCEVGKLIVGPTAGPDPASAGPFSFNCRCAGCGKECNVSVYAKEAYGGERIVREESLPEDLWNNGPLSNRLS
jgi:hypothetical protein